MSELITFAQGAILGGAFYDGVKVILANRFDLLEGYLTNKETEKFTAALEMLLAENQTMKNQLMQLMNNPTMTVTQSHSGSGDTNVVWNV
jgi:hypothetical protein